MLENLFTTKMSTNKKKLKNRFFKICSGNIKNCKTMSVFMAVSVIIIMLCANIVMAMVENNEANQFKFEVKYADTVLELKNKPFIYDGTAYLPLRELYEKCGFLEAENAYMQWDDGKIYMNLAEGLDYPKSGIKYVYYHYVVEIGKAEYALNPGSEQMYQQRWGISNAKQTRHAPILKNGVTYIPYEFVEYQVNRVMIAGDKINCSVWDLAYNNDTNRRADYINDSLSIDYADSVRNFQYEIKNEFLTSSVDTKNTTAVADAFYKAFAKKDYEAMKQYCTDECITNHYSGIDSPDAANVFGMSRAVLKNISVPVTANEIEKNMLYVTVQGETPPIYSFVGGRDVIVKVFFEKMADGTYLIDDFAY